MRKYNALIKIILEQIHYANDTLYPLFHRHACHLRIIEVDLVELNEFAVGEVYFGGLHKECTHVSVAAGVEVEQLQTLYF